MAQQPKRLPGERNPQASSRAGHDAVNAAHAAGGHGPGDFGARSAVGAFLDWRQRRKTEKARRRRLAE